MRSQYSNFTINISRSTITSEQRCIAVLRSAVIVTICASYSTSERAYLMQVTRWFGSWTVLL